MPAVRRPIREFYIDISEIEGIGKYGRMLKEEGSSLSEQMEYGRSTTQGSGLPTQRKR